MRANTQMIQALKQQRPEGIDHPVRSGPATGWELPQARDRCFALGIAHAAGDCAIDCDLVEAHKWFNLAAMYGHEEAAPSRMDISREMSSGQIAEAQRRAREWLRHDRTLLL